MIFKMQNNKWIELAIVTISYLLIDLFFRFFAIKSIYFYSIYSLGPILFSISIISFNLLIIYSLPRKTGTIFFVLSFLIHLILGIVQFFHYKILGTFFSFSELFLASEGLKYRNVLINYISFKFLMANIIIIIFGIVSTIKLLKRQYLCKRKYLLLSLVIMQILGICCLLINDNGYQSKSPNSPFYNYVKFEVPYKSIQTVGVLQYNIQDIFMYYKDAIKEKVMIKKYHEKMYNYFKTTNKEKSINKYTNVFKDKNLIYIMVESWDSWLLNSKDMPTLNKLKKEGLYFSNRYSPFFYAGYTINSEFAANTSYYLVDGFSNYINNKYPYSLPNLFKNKGYVVNSFHMNSGAFYNRAILHKSLGYENYYGNYNTKKYRDSGYNYVNDESWIDNEETYNLLVPKSEKKFMSFLVTYSLHLPYFNNGLCEQAIRDKIIKYSPWEKREEICLKYLATKTDGMVNKLLKKLRSDKMLDNTIIILFADHNTYGFSDKEYLKEVTGTSNINLQQRTPVIIWGSKIKHEEIDILMDTADLVPTIANMFGLDYNPNNYLSTDVFSKEHDPYVYFRYGAQLNSDGTYVSDGLDGKRMLEYNKYLLKSDYFNEG